MIFVRRDASRIPKRLMEIAEKAQVALEITAPDDRKDFIEKNARIWRAFARCLAKMSYGKCWYSESNDPQSFFDVDHFRPKKAAKRDESVEDDGYPWLAFSWQNFRYSAGRSNRLNTDEATEQVVGKGSWFPLLEGSVKASWQDRCEANEAPVLLDPTVRADVALIDIDPDDGRAIPSRVSIGASRRLRVDRSIEIYGLNLGNLTSARKRVIREVEENFTQLMEMVAKNADLNAIEGLLAQMRRATSSDASYARAARAKLHALGGAAFCAQPEDQPLAA